jgi:hypothetical protein
LRPTPLGLITAQWVPAIWALFFVIKIWIMPIGALIMTGPAAGGDGKRDRSTIEFPYMDLDNAIEIARAVHQAGGTCTKEQLAARMNQSATSGGFYLRVTNAKLFGFVSYERGTITQTKLGQQISDPGMEKAARVQAFLNVPLYRALFEKFKSVTLPPAGGLEGAIESLGVAPKQKDKARQAFQRSAKQAGFFEFGPERLVLPSASVGVRLEKSAEREPIKMIRQESREGLRGEPQYHPFIEGLLKTLPPAETQWPIDARKKWLMAAENIFALIYTD